MNKGLKNLLLSFLKTTMIEMAYTSGNHMNQNRKSSNKNSRILIIPSTQWIIFRHQVFRLVKT